MYYIKEGELMFSTSNGLEFGNVDKADAVHNTEKCTLE